MATVLLRPLSVSVAGRPTLCSWKTVGKIARFSIASRRTLLSSSSTGEEEPQILLETVTPPEHPSAIITQMTLNRPKANAMGHQMLQELQDSLTNLEHPSNQSRCLILTSSNPKVFSAGADLKERRTMSLEETELFVSKLRMTMQRVAELPMPVIAAVEGVAVGGGLTAG